MAKQPELQAGQAESGVEAATGKKTHVFCYPVVSP